MLSIKLVCVGKLKERFYLDAVNEYTKRLTAYCKLEICEIPEQRLPDKPSQAEIAAALEKEGAAIEEKLTPGAYVAAMCIEGRELDSREVAGLLTDCSSRGAPRLCFIIGGSNGLQDKIKAKADIVLSMSKMTFPHHLARVMLLEQIYRAFTIIEGGKYHK